MGPTLGGSVLYVTHETDRHYLDASPGQKLAGTISAVHGPSSVNLMVLTPAGVPRAKQSVTLAPGEDAAGAGGYCFLPTTPEAPATPPA